MNTYHGRHQGKDRREAQASPRFLVALLLIMLAPLLALAAGPQWWTDLNVLDPNATANDYAAINQGQLKNLATKAYQHLQSNLPSTVWATPEGSTLSALITSFQTSTNASRNDYAAVNLGQLKFVAKPFYDVLNSVGYTNSVHPVATNYPWTGLESSANDYAMANIGQAKNLFSFNLTGFAPPSIVSDSWKIQYFGSTSSPDAADTADPDHDGLTNLQEYQQNSDPTNYYSQGSVTITPIISVVSGDNQSGLPSVFLSNPLVIKIEDGSGHVLANAPVTFTVTTGSGLIATTNVGAPQTSSSLSLRTGATGEAEVYYKQPASFGAESHVTAQTGTAVSVQFTSNTAIPAPSGVRLWYYYNHIAFFWTPVAGIAADSYEIQQSLDNGSTWTTVGTAGGGADHFEIPSWTDEANVQFRVIAKVGTVSSNPSSVVALNSGISVRPESINVTLRSGESVERLVSILNNKTTTTSSTISATGVGVIESGYSWKDSDMTGGPTYVWNDISTTGNKLEDISDVDDGSQGFSIPFSFPFYGNTYTEVFVSSNGYVTLGSARSDYSNTTLPNPSAPTNIISAFWDDLSTGNSGDVYYLNESDKTTIQFDNVAPLNGSGAYTFQIVLYKTGAIAFYYKSLTGDVASSTVGIQNVDGTLGTQLSYNQAYLKNNFAIRFEKSWMTLSSFGQKDFGAGEMETLNAVFSTGGLAVGTYTASINVATSTGTLSVPVTLNIIASGQSDTDDSDGDGLSDSVERKYWGDLSQTGSGDYDGDGLSNMIEINAGTNPLLGEPGIAIVNPINEGQYELHSTINVSAMVSNIPDVSAVYFYLNGDLQIGMTTTIPYQTTIQNIGFGDYTITARVYTLTGNTYSSTVTIHVPNPYDTATGLPIAWEMQYFGHTGVSPTEDADGDGISNLDEYINGTNPTSNDTDGDGYSDSAENSAGSNPTSGSDTPDNSTQLTVKVGISDQDFNDDIWSLSMVTSDEDGNFTGSGSHVVDNQGNPHGTSYETTHIDYGKSVKFTMSRIEAGQYRATDEYTASFEPQGSDEKKKRWLAESDNSSLSDSLPWTGADGSTPPDPSSLKWVFTAVLADLSILKPDGSEVPEAQEETQGWIILPRGNDGKLITKLKLHKIVPSRVAGKYTLRTEGGRISLWKDDSGTQAIDATTEFDATVDTTIYAESASGVESGVQKIYLNWKNDEKGQLISNVDMVGLYPVGIDKIAFNYNLSDSSEDALNIRQDFSTPISVPEYVKNGQNKPAAYVKGKSIKILVRISSECPAITSLKIKGVSDDSGVVGDAEEKVVSFSGGCSKEGTDNPATTGMDESEFAKFTISTNIPNQIQKSVEAWKWYITEINGTAIPNVFFEKTSGHVIYVIWEEPKLPWDQVNGSAKNPWVKALDFAIDTANSKSKNDVGALASITSYLHTGHGLTYDTNGGRPAYASSNLGGDMNLSGYIEKKPGTTINCYDQACGVCSLGTLLGINVKYRYMEPFGYINTLNLVGEGLCNNPFYPISSSHDKISGGNDIVPTRYPFANHAFTVYGGKVYDATAGPQVGTRTEAQYLTDAIDTSTTAEGAVAGTAANIVDGDIADIK